MTSTRKDGAVITCFANIEAEKINWLWPGFIAFGKLSIIAGDPGLGKSLIALDLCSRTSKGYQLPADKFICPMGDVLILSNEDGPGDTIRPRLDRMKADVNRIHHLSMIKTNLYNGASSSRMFSLKRDRIELEKHIEEHPETKLIIIDPISAYCDGADTNNNPQVRALLQPLSEFAAKHKVAVLCITHLNKGEQQNALNRLSGSIAFGAVARIVLLVAKDPKDESRRLVLQAKNNLGKDDLGLAYSIKIQDEIPIVEWENEYITITAKSIFSAQTYVKNSEEQEAIEWLKITLAPGKIESSIIQSMGNAEGFTIATLRRAKSKLHIASVKDGFGEDGKWFWELPKALNNP